MFRSTISYESLAESLAERMGSSVASGIVPDHAPNVDSESEPMEALASPVVSDSDSVEPSLKSEPFSGHDTPIGLAASDPDDEPLGSPDTADYYGGSKFFEDDPSKDNFIAAYPSSPPPSPTRSGPYYKRPRSSPSSSAGPPPKRCIKLPAPASPAPALHSMDALQRDDIGQDVRENGLEARIKRLEDTNRNTRNGNGSGSESDGGSCSKRTVHTARGCTYKEFLNYQPLNFKGLDENDDRSLLPRNEIQKLETELWNLMVRGTNVVGYKQRFQELALLYPRMVPEEEDKVESLMDQNVRVYAARQADNKRRLENAPKNNHAQQPPFKRQNVARAYIVRPSEKSGYAVGHLTRDCKIHVVADQIAPVETQRTLTCFACGKQGHFHSECPKLKNHNRGNQVGSSEARGMVYALGGGNANQDPNVVTSAFLLNNRYASILFDTGADRSFVSTAFGSLIDIAPSALDNKYDIELPDGKNNRS
ncbi:reverse transcriptase domain-containing protein [Tanacetum coccineum]|uniref:Reverse transcriptase domain-containing protein n=1 Tax=Tanacetum coccineum TaxID=301880 RepID=A0ABQ5DK87_9ASTR